MSHKFNVKSKSKLDNQWRREVMPPYETLVSLGLQTGDVMADIGCGIGYFSIPAAQIVGETGNVFAIDTSAEMIQEVEHRIAQENLTNIKTVVSEENDLKIKEDTISYAFLCNVAHELVDANVFITHVKKMLLKSGRLVIVEWEKAESEFGPPIDHRLAQEEVIQLLTECGFSEITSQKIGKYFYAVTAVPFDIFPGK